MEANYTCTAHENDQWFGEGSSFLKSQGGSDFTFLLRVQAFSAQFRSLKLT